MEIRVAFQKSARLKFGNGFEIVQGVGKSYFLAI